MTGSTPVFGREGVFPCVDVAAIVPPFFICLDPLVALRITN